MRQPSRNIYLQKRASQKVKIFNRSRPEQVKMQTKEREQYVLMQKQRYFPLSRSLELLRYKHISKQGSNFSLLSLFKFESQVDFNMAESTSSDNRLPSGYQEDFVEEVEEDFQCPICHLPLKEPVLTRCGHRYCKECLDEHIGRYEFMISSFQYCCSFSHLI